MINKDFCLSSYIGLRYIYKDNIDFFEGMHHKNYQLLPDEKKIFVKNAEEIHKSIKKTIENLYEKYDNIGILLSGGMDSAIVASYLKKGSNAYTFANNETNIYNLDIERAKYYCEKLGLKHNLIDISFDDYKKYTPIVMKNKCAPVHSIEPQIYKAAIEAKKDGVEIMLIGDGADYVFGGMDKLLSVDWNINDFINRYISLDPNKVLTNPIDIQSVFEPYRKKNDEFDLLKFMDGPITIESYGSYKNAFETAKMEYCDPYDKLKMAEPLDLNKIRNGESKYLIRKLFTMRFPELEVPAKIPMPRPVDYIFKDWNGPTRKEFRSDINISELTGNQKWQLWCAELFLNEFDNK